MNFLRKVAKALTERKKETGLPTYKDYTGAKAEWFVFKESIQFLPATAGLVAMPVFGAAAFAFGMSPEIFAGLSFSALASVCGFLYKYNYSHKQLVEEYFADLDRRTQEYRERRVSDLYEDCIQSGFEEGVNAVLQVRTIVEAIEEEGRLKEDRRRIQEFLDYGQKGLDEVVEKVAAALALWKAVQRTPVREIQKEIKEWESENVSLRKGGGNESRIATNEKRITSNEDLLSRVDERKKDVNSVIAYCTDVENALHRAQLEMPLLMASFAGSLIETNVAKDLLRIIEAKVEVEKELRRERLPGRVNTELAEKLRSAAHQQRERDQAKE